MAGVGCENPALTERRRLTRLPRSPPHRVRSIKSRRQGLLAEFKDEVAVPPGRHDAPQPSVGYRRPRPVHPAPEPAERQRTGPAVQAPSRCRSRSRGSFPKSACGLNEMSMRASPSRAMTRRRSTARCGSPG